MPLKADRHLQLSYSLCLFFKGQCESPTFARCPVWKRHWKKPGHLRCWCQAVSGFFRRKSFQCLGPKTSPEWWALIGTLVTEIRGRLGIDIFFLHFKCEAWGPDIIAGRLGSSGFHFGEEGPSKIAPTVTLIKWHEDFIMRGYWMLKWTHFSTSGPGCNVWPRKTWLKMSRFPPVAVDELPACLAWSWPLSVNSDWLPWIWFKSSWDHPNMDNKWANALVPPTPFQGLCIFLYICFSYQGVQWLANGSLERP